MVVRFQTIVYEYSQYLLPLLYSNHSPQSQHRHSEFETKSCTGEIPVSGVEADPKKISKNTLLVDNELTSVIIIYYSRLIEIFKIEQKSLMEFQPLRF